MGDETANKHMVIKVLNVVTFLLFFSSNLYSGIGPSGYYGSKITYITPAAYSFWVWTVTDLLLLGLVVYQFFTERVTEVIGWRFILIGVSNAIFINTYVKGHYIVAFIFALLTALLITHVYYDLKTKAAPTTWPDYLFINLPFSLWHAYIVVSVVFALFSAFGVNAATTAPGVGTKASVIIALAWLAATSVGYALHSEKGDVAGAAVIAWELFAIFYYQHTPIIHWVALVAFIVSLLAVVKSVFFGYRSGSIALDDSERAPLIG